MNMRTVRIRCSVCILCVHAYCTYKMYCMCTCMYLWIARLYIYRQYVLYEMYEHMDIYTMYKRIVRIRCIVCVHVCIYVLYLRIVIV
jgi:hypothetical protein